MAIAVTLNNVANLQNTTTAQTTLNNNNSVLNTALQDGLSRSGNAPNTMSANFDMNSNHILNLPAPGGPLEPVRLTDVASGINVVNGPVSYGTAPTAKVGLTAVTGTALTVAHSDSLPALDQTIAPNWTGQHTFNTAGGVITNIALSGATAGALLIQPLGTAGGLITIPNGPDTLVGRVTTDTLTNKTIPSPTISGGALTDLTITRPTFSGSAGGTYTLSFPTVQSPTITGGSATAITLINPTITGGTISSTTPIGSANASNSQAYFSNIIVPTVAASTSVLATGTGGVGYTTGAGGTVAQGTSRTTGVTLNAITGAITLFSANAATANTTWSFPFTNSAVTSTDIFVWQAKPTISTNLGNLHVSAIPGSLGGGATIYIRALSNISSDNIVISFSIFKSATS